MLSLPIVKLDGDIATDRTDFYATHRGRPDEGSNIRFNAAGAFHDDLVRAPQGWRIKFGRLEVYLRIRFGSKPGKALFRRCPSVGCGAVGQRQILVAFSDRPLLLAADVPDGPFERRGLVDARHSSARLPRSRRRRTSAAAR